MTDEQPEDRLPSQAPVFEASGQRIGDYQLGPVIGGGGMGTVYLAKQISLQRLVALKVLRTELTSDPVYMARFFQEVRLMAKMEHPDLVRAYEAGMDKGQAYFAMEYVPGSDLRTELLREKRLSERDVLTIAEHTAIPLKYAWDRFRIIHRDIKPANIMRKSGKSGCKLLDLGISKQLVTMSPDAELTETHTMVGSPAYISPEQARNQKDVDFHTDIYSLGITMYHLLAGEPPYDSSSPMEVIAMHFKMPVPDIRSKAPSVSRQTASLLKRMLAKDPKERPATWDETIGLIRDCRENLKKEKKNLRTPHSPETEPRRTTHARVRRILLSAALLMTAAAVTAFFMRSRKNTPQTGGEETAGPPIGEPVHAGIVQETSSPADLSDDELRERELRLLTKLSGTHESKGEYAEALAVWRNYRPPEGLRDDARLRLRIRNQIEYLQDQLKKQQSGELPARP